MPGNQAWAGNAPTCWLPAPGRQSSDATGRHLAWTRRQGITYHLTVRPSS